MPNPYTPEFYIVLFWVNIIAAVSCIKSDQQIGMYQNLHTRATRRVAPTRLSFENRLIERQDNC